MKKPGRPKKPHKTRPFYIGFDPYLWAELMSKYSKKELRALIGELLKYKSS